VSPLAVPPARIARADAALRASTALVPSGAVVDEGPELAWVLPTEGVGDLLGQRVPRRLAWCVSGALRDGKPFALQLDAGNLVLLGAQPEVERVLQTSGVSTIIPLASDMDEAQAILLK
jgi:hypothetical protein